MTLEKAKEIKTILQQYTGQSIGKCLPVYNIFIAKDNLYNAKRIGKRIFLNGGNFNQEHFISRLKGEEYMVYVMFRTKDSFETKEYTHFEQCSGINFTDDPR